MVRLKSHGGRLGNLGSKWRFRAGKIIELLAGGVSIPILDFPKYRKFMKILYDWDFCTFGPIDTFNLKCKRFQQKVSSLQQFWWLMMMMMVMVMVMIDDWWLWWWWCWWLMMIDGDGDGDQWWWWWCLIHSIGCHCSAWSSSVLFVNLLKSYKDVDRTTKPPLVHNCSSVSPWVFHMFLYVYRI